MRAACADRNFGLAFTSLLRELGKIRSKPIVREVLAIVRAVPREEFLTPLEDLQLEVPLCWQDSGLPDDLQDTISLLHHYCKLRNRVGKM